MRKVLLVVLGILVAAFLVVDGLVRSFAEDKAAEEVAERLELTGNTEISIGGWPFLFRLVAGSFPSIEIRADEVSTAGVKLAELRATLLDVEVSAGDLLSGSADAVTAAGGRGSASLTSESLASVVADRYDDVSARIQGGRVLLSSPRLPEPVAGRVRLDGNTIVIRAPGFPRRVRVELPRIVEGLAYESITLSGSRAAVSFSLEDARLTPGD